MLKTLAAAFYWNGILGVIHREAWRVWQQWLPGVLPEAGLEKPWKCEATLLKNRALFGARNPTEQVFSNQRRRLSTSPWGPGSHCVAGPRKGTPTSQTVSISCSICHSANKQQVPHWMKMSPMVTDPHSWRLTTGPWGGNNRIRQSSQPTPR